MQMLTVLSLLSALAVTAFVFFLFYPKLRRQMKDERAIQQRMMGIEQMSAERQPLAQSLARRQPGERKPLRKLEDTPFAERVLIPLKKNIEDFFLQFTSAAIQAYIGHKMQLAGRPARGQVGPFLLKMVFFCILFGGGMFYAVAQNDAMPIVRKISFLVLGGMVGLLLPVMTLRRQIKNRQEAIQKQLPEVLDLLCVSVQAGLSFDAALRKIVGRMKGPFVAECRKMLDDVRMGMTRRDALLGVADRCGVQEVSLFVTSIIQAERLGSNLSNTLSVQADNVRERHRQWVKAMALKAPVKIVLPLVGCILPAIFIVALGPAMFNIAKNLFK